MNHWILEDGISDPLGAVWIEELQGFNFSLYSKEATEVTLCFFDVNSPLTEILNFRFDAVINRTGAVWHCFIKKSELSNANAYAYRINGPDQPGNRFDVSKLLLDPWSKAVYFPESFSRIAAAQPGDNIGKAALSVLISEDSSPGLIPAQAPVHYHDLIIYELHVKGFTSDPSSGLATNSRGTYSGVAEMIPYLLELGVTAVELLPVHQFDPGEKNYWGYNTLNFFSPHHAYGTSSDSWELVREFKEMVQKLHLAGIEVILDVIYNHTVEADDHGPVYSFKGIDNSSYYLLTQDLKHYINDAGTGNVLRTSYKMVRKMVLDSLRYWVEEMNVDGFRFDLASIFTRNDDGSVNLVSPPILEEISMDPVLSKVRLIAEPWDISQYHLGHKFPGASWAQWNGEYRDDIRKFVKSDPGMVAKTMTRIYGSPDLFPPSAPYNGKPYQTINFVNCHDGFSLYDLVAYNEKRNLVNGHNNTDGSSDNKSWNCGWEGDENVPDAVMQLRKKQTKNFMSILFFSNGIPMIRMGDEFLHTQNGNNNPYNQDNAISWLNWDRKTQFEDIFRFFKLLIACRKAHPTLCRGNYWQSDITWYGTNGQTDISFESHTLAYYLSGQSHNDNDFYVMINTYWEPLTFSVQVASENWKTDY
jgi:isoamylase